MSFQLRFHGRSAQTHKHDMLSSYSFRTYAEAERYLNYLFSGKGDGADIVQTNRAVNAEYTDKLIYRGEKQ